MNTLCCFKCNQDFDLDERKPLILNCGHTICKDCVIKMISVKDS